MQANQLLEHLVAALLVVGHQAAQSIRALPQQAQLIIGQRRIDDEQLYAAALGQAQDLRGDVLFVGEHQIIRTIRPLQRLAGLGNRHFGHALGIKNLQVHAQVFGGGLHELRITDPEFFLGGARTQEQHRFRARAGSVDCTEHQQEGVEKLEHWIIRAPEKWPRIIAPELPANCADSRFCPTIVGTRPGWGRLLMGDPKYCCANDQDDQKQNRPSIDRAIAFPCFGWVAHCIASCRFYR